MIGKPIDVIGWLYNQDKEKKYEVKEYKEKRGLKPNAKYWKQLSLLARKLNTSNDELHEIMIRRYSIITDYICVLSSVNLEQYHIKYYELDNTFMSKGKEFCSYKIFQPSSKMDKYEFSKLLDGLISECKECGVETMSPDEILDLKNQWEAME